MSLGEVWGQQLLGTLWSPPSTRRSVPGGPSIKFPCNTGQLVFCLFVFCFLILKGESENQRQTHGVCGGGGGVHSRLPLTDTRGGNSNYKPPPSPLMSSH